MIRFLITFGLAMIIIGIFYLQLQDLGLGEIPGDFSWEKAILYFIFQSLVRLSLVV